jgi:hypothetical protein
MLMIVNMIPNSWSDEENQDCEPNISVNPANRREIIGTTFTFDNPAGTSALSPAMTGNFAPIFSSVDGGDTWTLQFVLPSGAGAVLPTFDVTCRYGGNSGEVYSGLISAALPGAPIIINRAPNAVTAQATMTTVFGDQPFLEATTSEAGGISQDRLFVGYNVNGASSTLNVYANAATSAVTTANNLDVRFPFDMPPTRTAIHGGGTIYCAFYSYDSAFQDPNSLRNVVVVKDLNWGTSTPAFQALVDAGDGIPGVRVASGITNPWFNSNFLDPNFGNDRYGPDLTIAVDPNDVDRVYIAYMTGTLASDATLHLRWSADGGQNWSKDVRTISRAKNPSLAINAHGVVGFVYQQVVATNWTTILEVSDDGFVSSFLSHILAITPTNTPTPATDMRTYLGDYIKLQAFGEEFYGIFCAGNAPVKANFPSGVVYQRNVNWATQTLLGSDGVTPVNSSIDPFFFKLRFGIPRLTTAIADKGSFGRVCLGSFADQDLTIDNSGTGMLEITSIVAAPPDFESPSVLSYPIKLGVGDAIDIPIRFAPTGVGLHPGTITITSNDPASPHIVRVFGDAPTPRLSLAIANSGNFGEVCVGKFIDEPLLLNNSGHCPVTVFAVTSSSAAFLPPEVLSFPLLIGPGDSLALPIRFAPKGFGSAVGAITVASSDPASPHTVRVTGDAPPGKLAVAGSTTFGGVNACCCADRTLSVCNVGDCALNVTSVHFKRKSRHWKILHNPFPAKLHPGSCLPVVIQYHATEKIARACELVIESDDPATPVKIVEVLAYTIWECGCKEGCGKEDCDDCRKNCCDKHSSCRQGYPCCDDDDDEDRKGE